MASIKQWFSTILPSRKEESPPPPTAQRTPPPPASRPSQTPPATATPRSAAPSSAPSAPPAPPQTGQGVQGIQGAKPSPTITPAPQDTSVIEFTPSSPTASLSREKREEIIRTEMRRLFRKSESDAITENLFKTVLEYRLEKSE